MDQTTFSEYLFRSVLDTKILKFTAFPKTTVFGKHKIYNRMYTNAIYAYIQLKFKYIYHRGKSM